MRIEIADVLEAMHHALEMRGNEDKGRASYDGGSWGYHGHYLIDARQKAEKHVGELLDAYIDRRMESAERASAPEAKPATDATSNGETA